MKWNPFLGLGEKNSMYLICEVLLNKFGEDKDCGDLFKMIIAFLIVFLFICSIVNHLLKLNIVK